MGGEGLEPVNVNECETNKLRNRTGASAAECGADVEKGVGVDAELAKLVAVWPGLTEAARKAIVAIATQ